jgi:hypothetical protein
MAGTLTVGTLSDGTNSGSATDAIKGSARAWVNFQGTGTVSIRANYNVSSITDNGTGTYTLNFTNAMPDTNYVIFGSTRYNTTENVRENIFVGNWRQSTSRQTTSCKISTVNTSPGLFDCDTVMVGILR